MYSSPLVRRSHHDSQMFSPNQSGNDSVFGAQTVPSADEANKNAFLFGNKRRSIAVSGTPSFAHSPSTGPSAPATDIFASPAPSLPTHLREPSSGSAGKSVHWSPALVREKESSLISPSPIRKTSAARPPSFASPAMNGPPLRSLRDEIEPVKKAPRRSMNIPINHSIVQSSGDASGARASPASAQNNASFAEGAESETWVTVFGFPPENAASVLKYFSRHGEVVSHQVPARGNWMHIRYSCGIHARQALSRNATILNGTIRIGVVPCTEKELVGSDSSPATMMNRSVIDQSIREEPEDANTMPALSSRDQNTSVLDTSVNQSRLSIASRTGMRSLSSAYETSIDNRAAQPVKEDSIMNKLWTAVGF